jgi:hypothetical protein
VPDRLSLISPPESATEALIETVRACILETASDIKLENWLHPGVYRFWVAGMRGRLLGLKNEARNK